MWILLVAVWIAGCLVFHVHKQQIKRWIFGHSIRVAILLLPYVMEWISEYLPKDFNLDKLTIPVIKSELIDDKIILLRDQGFTIALPYDRMKVAPMTPLVVRLIFDDRSDVIITQPPGTPYSISANSLRARAIIVDNPTLGRSKTFDRDQIPGWVDELLYDDC